SHTGEICHAPPFPAEARHPGPAPERTSYGSFCSFTDPDGNTWLVEEVTTRLPGRIDTAATAFASTADLASALRRAEAAHAEHQKRDGRPHLFHRSGQDEDWPAWYAAHMAAEQAGTDLPAGRTSLSERCQAASGTGQRIRGVLQGAHPGADIAALRAAH